ncbi:hypothetical protein P9847_19675 [Paenibacillus chibensis]|uniref:DUF4367 domain-containing protein n=1 Tax=Paenibacillus chibensis TaxID=59846 RepID=A0ABU6PXB0_9BACL|nr:hypothetical protein [Paenibacillus chibensis]
MNKHAGVLVILLAALLAGCSSDKQTSLDYGKPSNQTRMVITDKGYKWDIDNSATSSFDETLKKVSFEVKQIRMPFPPTHTAASMIQAPFDMIQLTYANLEMGRQIILVESNSQDKDEPKGKDGPKLKNGEPSWIQSDSNMSALYWRHDGLTFLLISNQIKNQKFVPLYSPEELVQVADTIQ